LVRHALPEEDTLHHRAHPDPQQINLALILYPYASNLDEFDPLVHEPGVTVVPTHGVHVWMVTTLSCCQAVKTPLRACVTCARADSLPKSAGPHSAACQCSVSVVDCNC